MSTVAFNMNLNDMTWTTQKGQVRPLVTMPAGEVEELYPPVKAAWGSSIISKPQKACYSQLAYLLPLPERAVHDSVSFRVFGALKFQWTPCLEDGRKLWVGQPVAEMPHYMDLKSFASLAVQYLPETWEDRARRTWNA